MSLTIRKMQKYLKEKYKRTKPEDIKNTQRYFLKLIEEVGELSEVIRKEQRMENNNIKGTIEEEAVSVLKEVGKWLRQNGEAIYNTRTAREYHYGNTWFTANKDGKTLYAIYALPEGEKLPSTIEWENNIPTGNVVLLQNGKKVKYSVQNNKVTVYIPKGLKNEALAFKFKVKK